jgi:NNP family nitrate/nitrite transporter-like MFS transporter
VLTGVVGAAGGLGGFCLPLGLGGLGQLTGSFGGGFALLGLASLTCVIALGIAGRGWHGALVPVRSTAADGLRSDPVALETGG